jgi:hypothetical protein
MRSRKLASGPTAKSLLLVQTQLEKLVCKLLPFENSLVNYIRAIVNDMHSVVVRH